MPRPPRRSIRTIGVMLMAVTMVAGAGASPAGAATEIDLTPHLNNVGIQQLPTSTADFDGVGWSYSMAALRLGDPRSNYAGVEPGQTITTGGFTFTWPNRPAGSTDNVVTLGQTIALTNAAGATKIGFLGSATNGPTTGTFTLNYTYVDAEGVTREEQVNKPITFSDWTLNAGGASPAAGNTIVLKNLFRSASQPAPCCVPDQDEPHVFLVSTPLDPTKTLQSIKLPQTINGQIHLFGMAIA
ncbi:MAG: hypothetical protein ACRDH9_11405 [Actinomycetota bacterium]